MKGECIELIHSNNNGILVGLVILVNINAI